MEAEVGAVYDGKVTGLTDYGAFVEFDEGKVGMVHISEVAQVFVKNIREHLSLNQEVKVKVISVAENGKINLSIKKTVEKKNSDVSESEDRYEKTHKFQKSQRNQSSVWQGTKSETQSQPQSFEEMMAHFKQVSDEKITDLKRASESKHGGYSRRSK